MFIVSRGTYIVSRLNRCFLIIIDGLSSKQNKQYVYVAWTDTWDA